MSDAFLIAVIGVIGVVVPVLITQVAGIIIALNARREIKEEIKVVKEDNKMLADEQTKKLEETSVKLDTIHDSTNSNLTEIKKQLQESIDENRALRKERDEKAGAEGRADE